MNKQKKGNIRDYIFIIIGTTIIAAGINFFYASTKLVTGGISGLAIVVEYVSENAWGWGIPLWLTNIVVNIPLFAISIKQRGKAFGGKSLFASTCLSLALWYTSFLPTPLPADQTDLLLSSIFGALFVGTGIGLVLRASATTGGTDMLASIIKFKYKSAQISKLMLIIDSTIILIGCYIFGVQKAMYALICVYVTSKVIDTILEGMNFSKAAFIISDKSEIIAEKIMKELPRGVTGIYGRGMYTKKQKELLFVVVAKKEIIKLQQIVKNIDPKVFITVTDVREVMGQGFIEETDEAS
jgi:uncharacterized membrane-anchored protein YitT (DUF2179 family)